MNNIPDQLEIGDTLYTKTSSNIINRAPHLIAPDYGRDLLSKELNVKGLKEVGSFQISQTTKSEDGINGEKRYQYLIDESVWCDYYYHQELQITSVWYVHCLSEKYAPIKG
jgi:hypothetical protein